MEKNIYLIRHGESMHNAGLNDSVDSSLTPRGRAQASGCAEFISGREACGKDALILSSPFKRCVLTSKRIQSATGAPVKLESVLHEYYVPAWFPEKIRMPGLDVIAEEMGVEGSYDSPRWWPEDYETEHDLDFRSGIFANRILNDNFKYRKIICVTHYFPIQALTRLLVPGMEMPFVANASVTRVDWDGKHAREVYSNNTSFQSDSGKVSR